MHLADGVLSLPVVTSGFIAAAGLVAWSMRQVDEDEVPRIAVFTAAFFVASLIHFKLPGTSVHLTFHGLLGVVLGRRAVLAIVVGLFLQAALLAHGGMSVLGVNTCLFGFPALLAAYSYSKALNWFPNGRALIGGLCAALAVLLSGVLMMAALLLSRQEDFGALAQFALIAHLPIALLEGVITGLTVSFLHRVQPRLLEGGSST